MIGMVRKQNVFLTCMLALHVAFGVDIPAVGPRVNPSECRSLMDLYIVIDGSDSISKPDFIKLQQAIGSMVPQIDLGPKKARIGMLVYSSHVPYLSEHPFSNSAPYLISAADTLEHPRDGTNTALGIQHMRTMFTKHGRDNVPWVSVVLTDGISKDPAATALEADEAAKMGISMFAVGIGHRIALAELANIASSQKQVLTIDNFDQLRGVLASMMTKICPCPVPPVLQLAKCGDGARAIGTVRTYQCMTGYLQRGVGTITCQDDFTWTPLSLDFQCVPCSETTPIVQHGTCGGGDYTLGSRRLFTCHPGYLAVGNPEIHCRNDATWSVPDFQCMPCSDTPVVQHGSCGVGDYTLGAVRTFTCNPGYLAVGSPDIRCLDNAKWSVPDFRCIPCGETPVIAHGTCGGGEYTIGAQRSFACDVGYLAVGNPIITCDPRAQWTLPQFQCIPCGDTPVIPNGVCGGGDYTLGASRSFTCNPGYLAVGNPHITCDPNAQWTMPQFQCIPCGDTPVIPNGVCGGGDYTLGASRSFTCNPGYLAVGNPIITCDPNAQWTMPQFQCIPCGDTPTIANGVCGGGDYTLGASRSFTCNPGYLAVGNPIITCDPNAQWTMPQFQCIPCGDTPVIPNGVCGGGDYTLGASRSFTCNPGYLAVGNPIITCDPNAQWTMPQFQCIPCGDTPVIPNGVCGGGDYTLGASRSFTCNPGYLAVGNPHITCDPNAQWTMPKFQCIPCGDTPVIPNGVCGGGDYTLGASRSFTCNPGYLAVGNPHITCDPNAQWTTPQFQCIPCGDTPVIPNGVCGGGDYTLGASRSFICNPGYLAVGNPIITCDPNAQWTMPQFQCIPCGDTPTIANGVCGGGDYTLGASRSFTCNPGYLAVGNPHITCDPNAQWTMPQFQCIPCGDTPVIPNGVCGGGDYTLGASRSFTCNPGYLAVGNPIITCDPNAQWTMPQFQCIPCGDTPVIPHGSCGGGEYTLGARRMFTCDAGYKGVGDPHIRCMPDATWSLPNFRCTGCGETPVISNGYCGGGESILGAMRRFACNDGYLAVGNPDIKCLDDASWSVHDFQCIPCGETPLIAHGTCGGGLYTLGASRTFACDAGYLQVGNPSIVCQPNAQWSLPQVQCVPCGETPIISHGSCGGGEYTIGARRQFACDAGYLAVGDPYIMCQPDATWSPHQFHCMPCGETPLVQHGICGSGDYTLGAKRMFTCEPGYKAVGIPDIMCQNDATWSIPDFKCIPCGETPLVQYATCGGGDHLLGSRRTYLCDAGYALIGSPDITCKPDASWTVPDFRCSPCGDTPVIPNGECGGGENFVGTKRMYTCHNGFIPKGNPEITCLDTAMWSQPAFQCLDCGAPPVVVNAYTGLGPATVGSTLEYFCDVDYEMYGRGQITCLPSGIWEQPNFSCNVRTTTTTTTPSPIPHDPSVCDACRFINGVGYQNHPFDCNQYVQCFNGNKAMEPVYRMCPFGLFWDQNVLTCRPADQVDCPHDQCKGIQSGAYKHTDPNSCCSYWKCEGGRSYGECCGEGYAYSAALGQCVEDYTCEAACPFHDELPACDKRPNTKDTMYEQHIGNNAWVAMPCAPGTAFNPVDCECSLLLMTIPGKTRQQVCKPELYLPFTNGFGDNSGKNVYILPENVSIHEGAAWFNGNSRILVNRFSNTEFVGDLVIRFRYNEFRNGPYFQQLQALVTNGDCGADPSIVVAKMPGYVLLGAKTDAPKSFALPTLDKVWKEVIYIHNEKKLEGRVCGASMNKWSYGSIQATHCALQIGKGSGLQSYHGLIDDLYVYQCRPRSSMLSINY